MATPEGPATEPNRIRRVGRATDRYRFWPWISSRHRRTVSGLVVGFGMRVGFAPGFRSIATGFFGDLGFFAGRFGLVIVGTGR